MASHANTNGPKVKRSADRIGPTRPAMLDSPRRSERVWEPHPTDFQKLEPLISSQARAYRERFGPELASDLEKAFSTPPPKTITLLAAGPKDKPFAYGCTASDGHRAILANLWSENGHADTVRELIRTLLDVSFQHAAVVEAQDLGFGMDDLSPQLTEFAEETHRRLFLSLGLKGRSPESERSVEGPFTLRRWQAGDLLAGAELTESAYRDTLDSHINGDYRSLGGCLRRLANTVEGRTWGPFLPQVSPVAVDGLGKHLGFILVSSLGCGHAHLVDVCVHPQARGQGVGRALLLDSLRRAARQGLQQISLSVSEQNIPGLRLYQSAGFDRGRSFNAYLFGPAR